jgi:hypothetical protein
MSAECVYQYRYYETNPELKFAGSWTAWYLCTAEEYAWIVEKITEGQTYQLRVLQVSYSYPSDDYIKEHYKVKDGQQT